MKKIKKTKKTLSLSKLNFNPLNVINGRALPAKPTPGVQAASKK